MPSDMSATLQNKNRRNTLCASGLQSTYPKDSLTTESDCWNMVSGYILVQICTTCKLKENIDYHSAKDEKHGRIPTCHTSLQYLLAGAESCRITGDVALKLDLSAIWVRGLGVRV